MNVVGDLRSASIALAVTLAIAGAPASASSERESESVASPGKASAPGGRAEPLPDDLEGVGVTEHSGDAIPLDLEFTSDRGEPVTLGELLTGDRPALMTMNYSSCPMLCSLHLNGLVEALSEMELSIGEAFDVLTVSIDPLETTPLARLTKQRYLRDYGRGGADEGWHFLTGERASIASLADALGFGYRLVKETGEYAHSAVTFVVTPDGRISRYLYGVVYDPKTVRLSLVEASEGRIGSTIDRILLFCFHYDAAKGRYGPAAERFMRAGGALTVLVLGTVLTRFWRRERRERGAIG